MSALFAAPIHNLVPGEANICLHPYERSFPAVQGPEPKPQEEFWTKPEPTRHFASSFFLSFSPPEPQDLGGRVTGDYE
jgi:hypothetical protein